MTSARHKTTRPARRTLGRLCTLLAVALVAKACGEGVPPTTTPPPDPPRPTTVTVSPATAQLSAIGATVQLSAQVLDQNGAAMAGVSVTWTSGDSQVALVDAAGTVTAAANGTATITAAAGSVSGAAAVTVAQVAASASVTPESAMLGAIGDTVRLVAEVLDAGGHAMPDASVAWSSSDASVASVDASGLVTAVSNGTATITATVGAVSGAAEITVEEVLATSDRAALEAFYHAAGGQSWVNSHNWLTDAPLIEWYGVVTNHVGRVEVIDLYRNGLTGTIPPEVGQLDSLRHLGLGYNDLTGPIPPELGRLGQLWVLHLEGNRLTGGIPPELGTLSGLESLFLHENDLSGPLPAELGRLARLKWLQLSANRGLTGALPSSLTDLSLQTFMTTGTDLCAPREPAFDAWLATITRQRIARCGEMMAYLVQAVQSRTHPVPLVAGERALLRVFVTAARTTSEGIPPVRARFYLGDVERHVADIPAKSTPIPTTVDEGDLAKSANVEVPADIVAPGLEMVIEVDPQGTLDSSLGVPRRIPAQGRLAVEVHRMPQFDLTVIPFLFAEEPDSAVIDIVAGMAADPDGHHMLELTRTLLPVADLEVTAHPVVVSTSKSAFELLSQTEIIRAMSAGEEGAGHHLGLITGSVTGAAGVANIPGRVAFARAESFIIAHELGHNMNLQHTSCGDPVGQDPAYPQAEGRLGVWGYDFRSGQLVDPLETYDLMGYCDPIWVSDYHFNIALRHRLADEGRPGAPEPALILSGGTDQHGRPFLNPAFVADAPATPPDESGDYAVTGRDAGGRELFSVRFAMSEVADYGSASLFAFALPARREWAGALAEITLSGPGGTSVTLDGDGDRSMAIVIDQRSGRVRAVLRDLPAAPRAEDGTEVLFSRGVPAAEAWRR